MLILWPFYRYFKKYFMSHSTTGSKDAQLARTISLSMAVILVISSIIGSGVFKKVAPMTAELSHPPGYLLPGLLRAWSL